MLSQWFLTDTLDTHGIHFHHDPLLVALSYLVAVFAAYTSFHLRECIQAAATPNARRIWLATASFSMGLGVWSMHFVAVLAMKMPVPVGYDLKITALSAGFAVVASWIAFSLLESGRGNRTTLLAGVIFGAGVALMHYVGVAAMRLPARIYLDPWFFALSAVVALGLSTVALYTIRDLQDLVKGRILWVRVAGSAMLGLAISLMHYSGMLATTFAPDPGSPQAGFVLDSSLMAAAVTAAAFLMVGLALIAARVDHNRSQTHRLTAALIDIMPGFFALLDPAGRFTRWNANLAALTGLGDDELRGLHASSIAVPDDRAAVDAKIQEVFARGSGSLEFGLLNKTGEVHAVNWSGRLIKYQDRDCVLAIGLDIEERRAAEARILESEDRFRTVFSSVNDGISVHDAATAAFLEVNPRLCEMFGYSRDEMLKLDPGDLSTGVPPYGREDIARVLKQVMQSDQGVTVEWHSKAKDGHTFWVEISACRRLLGAKYFLISIARDITERKRADELIAQLAHYDALTGLANRRIFVTALEQAVSRSRRNSEVFAVLYLDLDHFKDVNDTLGHPAGDLLLRAVAERLKAGLREVDTVARFGGDEFAVILANLKDASAAGSLADSIIQTLGVPFSIQGHEIRSSATIGIGVYGADAPDAETILSQADLALYRAKSEGRGTYRFFTDAMDAEIRARLSLTRELSQALDADQLFLEYQPQLNIDTGQIVGLECLLRWQHPSRGVLAPDSFIPLAESSGLIVPLGRWVMRAACRQIHQWLDAGITPPVAGINLSGVQFKRSQQLEKDIALSLAEFGVPAWRLELELTESALMAASRGPHDVLLKLRAQGHRIVIDDFGSGYSSLDYLRRFPADRIKITQTFTSGIGRTPEGDAIVRAALALAQQFRMEVVVDGVETRAQLELLRTWGCRIVQGCYFARPADAAAITALLRAGRVSPTPAEEVEASLQTLGARTRA